jgi:hypothetical protein
MKFFLAIEIFNGHAIELFYAAFVYWYVYTILILKIATLYNDSTENAIYLFY